MKIADNITGIHSQCPVNGKMSRDEFDLNQIKAAIETLDGNIEDFLISKKDRGQELVSLENDLYRWDWVTDFFIQPKRFGGMNIQRFIENLGHLVLMEKGSATKL